MHVPASRHGLACWCASAALAACASAPRPAPVAATPAPPAVEASYDWHVLLMAPFGAMLKDMPFGMHEVLLFKDAAQGAPADDAECYAVEQTPPRFVAHAPQQYLVCFRHDRLARVEARVALPKSEAPLIFADACALWQSNAAAAALRPGATAARAAAAAANSDPAAAHCAGQDGGIGFAARLETEAEHGDATLLVELYGPDQQ